MRLYLKLDEEETKAISKLASIERRDIQSQASIIIRQELERRGLIPMESITIIDRHHGDEKAEFAAALKAAAEFGKNG